MSLQAMIDVPLTGASLTLPLCHNVYERYTNVRHPYTCSNCAGVELQQTCLCRQGLRFPVNNAGSGSTARPLWQHS